MNERSSVDLDFVSARTENAPRLPRDAEPRSFLVVAGQVHSQNDGEDNPACFPAVESAVPPADGSAPSGRE